MRRMVTLAGTRIATIALLVGALTFVLVSCRDPGYVRLHLDGGMANPTTHRDAATFVVDAASFSSIELTINGHRAASAYVPWNAREIRFEGTPLDDGRNIVVAQTTLWYAASRKAHTAVLTIDNPPEPVARSRAAPQAPQSHAGRSLSLAIREQAAAADFAVQLPRNDRAIIALRSGRIDLATFVDDVFGTPRLNRKLISSFFAGMRPRLYVAHNAVTVNAASGYQRLNLEDLPAFTGDVDIANAFTGPKVRVAGERESSPLPDTRRWAYDVLRLHVSDYRVVDRAPAPLRTQGGTYVWERPFADVRTHVAVSLAFAPFSSLDALRSALNLPVFAFAPHVVARFLAFSHGFVLAVPIFAYLVLSRGRNAKFATVARSLIVVAVAADVFDACISAQPDVDSEILLIFPGMRVMPPPLISLLFVPVLIGSVLALLAMCIAHLAARARSLTGMVISDAANAVAIASLGFVAIVAAGYAFGNVARVPFVYSALVGGALAAMLVAILIAIGWWTIPGDRYRPAFTTATVMFALAVAVPVSLVRFGVWATIPEHLGTAFADPLAPLPLTASFLRSLAPLCPLAFGLLLIAGVRPDPQALGLSRANFARLVFCSYAVLAGVVVIIPIGFVLAWSTYGLLRERDARAIAPRDAGMFLATPRERGLAAIPLALAFVLVEALLLLPSETRHLRELHTPFIVLEAAGFVGVIVSSLVLPAFAIAASGVAPAGTPALRRALGIGCWAIACSLPAWFLHSDNLVTAAAIAIVTGLFYATLGVREANGDAASLAFARGIRRNRVFTMQYAARVSGRDSKSI